MLGHLAAAPPKPVAAAVGDAAVGAAAGCAAAGHGAAARSQRTGRGVVGYIRSGVAGVVVVVVAGRGLVGLLGAGKGVRLLAPLDLRSSP